MWVKVHIALISGSTQDILLNFLEMRLDTTLFRMGLVIYILEACQLVTYRHIKVNGFLVPSPSYSCRSDDCLLINPIITAMRKLSTLKKYLLFSRIHVLHFLD